MLFYFYTTNTYQYTSRFRCRLTRFFKRRSVFPQIFLLHQEKTITENFIITIYWNNSMFHEYVQDKFYAHLFGKRSHMWNNNGLLISCTIYRGSSTIPPYQFSRAYTFSVHCKNSRLIELDPMCSTMV